METTKTISIARAQQISGWMSEPEMLWLATLASQSDFGVEVGSWRGRSTVAMGQHIKQTLFSVDHFSGSKSPNGNYDGGHEVAEDENGNRIYREFCDNTFDLQIEGRIFSLRCDSATGSRILKQHGLFDFVFLDGNHYPDAVKQDIETWLPLIKPGGLLLGHDWKWPGLADAVMALLPDALVVCDSIWQHRTQT